MALETIAGAVNGVAVTRAVENAGSNLVTIPFANNGVAGTKDVETDGNGWGATSSRVALIGGSTSGRDHFPWPVTDPPGGFDPGEGSAYPFYLTAAQVCRWAFRVKRWQFNMEINYLVINDDPSPGTEHNGTGSVQFEFEPYVRTDLGSTDPILPTSESELILPRFFDRYIFQLSADGSVDIGVDGGDPIPFAGFNAIGSASYSEGLDAIVIGELYFSLSNLLFDAGSVLPFFELRLDSLSSENPLGTGGHQPGDNIYQNVEVVDIIDGDIAITSLVGDADNGGKSIIFSFPTPISIAPIEFWPYATRGGLPVYDTGDGSIINDPLS